MELIRVTEAEYPTLEELMCIFYSEKEHAGMMPLEAIPGAIKQAAGFAHRGVYMFLLRSMETGTSVGYMFGASVYSNEYRGFIFFLDEFMIHPAYRSHGFGAKAVSALKKWVRENDFVGIALETTKTNAAARRFYTRHGFTVSDRVHMLAVWAQKSSD